MNQDAENLKTSLLELSNDLYNAAHFVAKISEQTATNGLVDRIKHIIESFNSLNRDIESLEIDIPQDVLFYIDDGRNPDVYTRQFIELLQKDNQFLNGKLAAFKEFSVSYARRLVEVDPDLREAVAQIVDKPPTE